MEFLVIGNDKTSRDAISILLQEEGFTTHDLMWDDSTCQCIESRPGAGVLADVDSCPPASLSRMFDLQRAHPQRLILFVVAETELPIPIPKENMKLLHLIEKPFNRDELRSALNQMRPLFRAPSKTDRGASQKNNP